MRAKILLLTQDESGEQSLETAERALTDVAAAFGHTFVLMRARLTNEAADEIINRCLSADAVFFADANAKVIAEIGDALGAALCVRVSDVPQAITGEGKRLFAAQAMSMDDETMAVAFDAAASLALREELPVAHVAPGGKTGGDWLNRAQTLAGARALTAPEAVTEMAKTPETLGLLLAPTNVGAILHALITALAPHPAFLRDVYLGGDVPLFAPVMPSDAPLFSPWGVLQAAGDLLRDGLHLMREADCMEAAVNNVLAAGWRTADIALPGQARVDAEAITDLISEQIELAGELLGKGESFHENPLS